MGHDVNANVIDKLAALLDAEACGHPVDPAEVIGLAELVAKIIPEISPSMRKVIERMRTRRDRLVTA